MAAAIPPPGGEYVNPLIALTPLATSMLNYTGTAAIGTGILPLVGWGKTRGFVTAETLTQLMPAIPGMFGGIPYPVNQGIERGPSGLFVGLFAALLIAFLYVTFRNTLRGHNFFLYIGLAFFALLKVIGYSLRIAWNTENQVTNIKIAVASVTCIQVAQLAALVLNNILGHRIFTWNHPETGNSLWFNMIFYILYFFVLVVIVMAILGEAIPYLYFLPEYNYTLCKNVMKAAAILNVLYAGVPIQLVTMAFLFKPGSLTAKPWKRNHVSSLPPVFQPNWIQSTNPFYFVEKGSQEIVYKDQPAANAIRIIGTREVPAGGFHPFHHVEPMHPKSPRIVVNVLIVVVSSVVFMLNASFRAAACFKNSPLGVPNGSGGISYSYFQHRPLVMYIFYGATEVLVMAMYLLCRVDLRFYIPDMPRAAKHNPHPYTSGNVEDKREDSSNDFTP